MNVYPGGYKAGQWKAQCERCGRDFRSDKLRKEWTGLMVCHGPGSGDCWEPRHPQDFLRAKKDDQSVPWVAPRPPVVTAFSPILDESGNQIEDALGMAIFDSDRSTQPDDL